MGNTATFSGFSFPIITSSSAWMPEDLQNAYRPGVSVNDVAPVYGPGYTAQHQYAFEMHNHRHLYSSTAYVGTATTSHVSQHQLALQQQALAIAQQQAQHAHGYAQIMYSTGGGNGGFFGGGGTYATTVFHDTGAVHSNDPDAGLYMGNVANQHSGLALAAAAVPLRTESSADLDTVTELTPDIVDNYGAAEMQRSAQISDKLLALVGQDSGGEFSDKLGNLILTAKGLDPAEADKQRSWWKRFLNFLGIKAEIAAAQYKMLDAQLGTLVSELGVHSKRQVARKQDMESLYQENTRSYNEIESLVKKGRAFLERQKSAPVKEVATGMEAQQLADRQALQQRLDKRITDLDVAMTLMLQTAPEIRIMQASAQALIDKFTTLVNLTIPAWKKQFALHVLQLEQKRSAIVADAVDDSTNDAFVKNASLLHDNTVQVAAAGQRQLMDMSTVEHVQGEILRTVADVRQINADASANRQQIAGKLTVIRNDLVKSVAGQHLQIEAPKDAADNIQQLASFAVKMATTDAPQETIHNFNKENRK